MLTPKNDLSIKGCMEYTSNNAKDKIKDTTVANIREIYLAVVYLGLLEAMIYSWGISCWKEGLMKV